MSDLTNRLAVVDIPSDLVPYAFIPGGKGPLEMLTRDEHGQLKAMRREAEEAMPAVEELPEGQIAFQVSRFDLRDAMSELGRLEVDLMVSAGAEAPNLTDDRAAPSGGDEQDEFVKAIIGKPVMFAWACGTELERRFRYYHGIVSEFAETGGDIRATFYRAVVVPRLWRLGLRKQCRIFQEKNVPDIIKQVLEDNGLMDGEDVRFELTGTYEKRTYCVQYRESDFDFISRLMEEEGISYYFDHTEEKEVMKIADAPTAYPPSVPYDMVVVQTPERAEEDRDLQAAGQRVRDALDELETGQELEERIREFRFNHAVQPGKVRLRDYNFENSDTKPGGEYVGVCATEPEVYDYPGRFANEGRGKSLARIRQQELDAQARVGRGTSDFRSLAAGKRFEIIDHPRESYNRAYLCIAVNHWGTCEALVDAEGRPVGMGGTTYENDFECIPDDVQYRPPRVTGKPAVVGVQTAKVVGPEGEEIHTDKFLRVKVKFHWDLDPQENEHSSCWVRVVQPWADKGFGTVVIPRIGTEVLVEFLEGDPDRPIIHGAVYNDRHMPSVQLPEKKMQTGIRSNSTPGGGGDNEILLDDTKGQEKFSIHAQYDMDTTVGHDSTETVTGKKTVTVKGGPSNHFVDSGNRVMIVDNQYYLLAKTIYEEGTAKIELKCGGCTITMDPGQIQLNAKGNLITMDAGQIQAKVGGSTITLTSSSIVVNSAAITLQDGKINLKGSAIKVDGGTVSSKSDGAHEIKGSPVNINC